MSGPAEGFDVDDILVVIMHPFGNLEVTLRWWIEHGPGPRPFVRPGRARSRRTGQRLPLTVIPLAYRNTAQTRRAIRDGEIANPWPATWRLPSVQEDMHQAQPDDDVPDEVLGSIIPAYDDAPDSGKHRAV